MAKAISGILNTTKVLSSTPTNVAQKVALLANCLPSGAISIGAKQVESFESVAKIMGAKNSDLDIFSGLKKLFSAGKDRLLTIASRESSSGVGKDLSISLSDGQNVISKIETNSSVLGEIAEAVSQIQTIGIKRKIADPKIVRELKNIIMENPKASVEEISKRFPGLKKDIIREIKEGLIKAQS